MKISRILVIGACGQLGIELTTALVKQYGMRNVITADLRQLEAKRPGMKHIILNAMDRKALTSAVTKNHITQIYHLAAVLSAKGEKNPLSAWKLNMNTLINVLEVSRLNNLERVFWPSSIAVFGPSTPQDNTPQNPYLDPATVYGISKLAGERLCEYYWNKYGVDVRSIRYPGIISYRTPPGGGTTDYAVEIFHQAVMTKNYSCFLKEHTVLPMMYIDDAVRATMELMHQPNAKVRSRAGYNLAAFSFTPEALAEEIKKYIPDFKITYKPDKRQLIADTWPRTIDDSDARLDWGWQPGFSLNGMVKTMLKGLGYLKKEPALLETENQGV